MPYSYRILPYCNQPPGQNVAHAPVFAGAFTTSPIGGRLDAPPHPRHMQPMSTLKAVCVYCGSGPGSNPRFVESARTFGRILAENGIRLVYGGGSIGLMGAIADSVIDHGGQVTGIIPDFLKAREMMFRRAQEIIVTRDMHERKRLMFERADAFVALPGGVGTLEELVEQLTWAQLGRHKKPILMANIDGFWDPLCALFDHMRAMQFIRAGLSVSPLVVNAVEEILPALHDATRHISESEKEMKTVEPERL
jgi:uncharacterized protein (TIGR00730 family)